MEKVCDSLMQQLGSMQAVDLLLVILQVLKPVLCSIVQIRLSVGEGYLLCTTFKEEAQVSFA